MIPINISPSYLLDIAKSDKKTILPAGLVCFCRFIKKAILYLLLISLIFVVVSVSFYLVYCGVHYLMNFLDDQLGGVCKGREKSKLAMVTEAIC